MWRSIWWWLSTIMLMAFIGLLSLASIVYSPLGQSIASEDSTPGIDLLLNLTSIGVGLAFTVMLWSRRRWPFLYTLAGAIAGLILPIGPFFALVGLAEVIAAVRGKKLVIAVTAAATVTLWSIIGDAYAGSRAASFIQTMIGPQVDPAAQVAVPFLLVVVIILLLLGIPTGIGLIMRFRSRAHTAVRERDRLDGELGRSYERERIAHEIHDVLGHRLSQLSLRASALEAKAAQYPEILGEASQMRQSAAQSMDDLRSLLRVIHGDSNDVRLTELEGIVQNTLVDNQSVGLAVYLREAEQAPGEVARAVVRIVQEVITNARKHAPGKHLRLSVAGGPGEGVTIAAVNELGGVCAPGLGTSRGLSGMQERVRLLGGQFGAGHLGNEFRVDAHIPWPVGR